jgi:NAD-dependent dihydropyrimidine dehydrogenase PreA subunit
MATMITTECISCGACEPECPNNAISQGETIFVIDPNLCTECVGFHDFEACAAVCPVDCCVTDPNNVESEEALIARARSLHPETHFGDNFESRFRKGQGKTADAPMARRDESVAQRSQGDHRAASVAAAAASTAPPAVAAHAEPELRFVELPPSDSWTIPVRCYKCNETHVESVRSFMIGNVIWCPHCNKSMVVRDNLNFHIRTLLKNAYDKWEKEQADFINRRELELAEFLEKRAKDAQLFESHQQEELSSIRGQLQAIGEGYDAPGKPIKKGSRFGWG